MRQSETLKRRVGGKRVTTRKRGAENVQSLFQVKKFWFLSTMPPKKGKKSKKSAVSAAALAEAAAPKVIPAPPSVEDKIKTATLMRAVTQSNPQAITRLVAHYNYRDALLKSDINGTTALMLAAKVGDVPTVERLLSMQSATETNIDAREISSVGGFAALHHACKDGHPRVVEALLRFGANPDLQSNNPLGETPLQVCCKRGPEVFACAKMLLTLGAKPNAVDKFNNTAAFWATSRGHGNMATELGLVNKPANPDAFMQAIMSRIPNFQIPSGKGGKKKSGGKKKKKT